MADPRGEDLDDWIADLVGAAAGVPMTVQEHRYGPERDQVADLRLPDSDPPHPVAVIIHGGAFRAHFGRKIMDANAVDLTRRGYATWNIEYRRTDCGGGPVATTDDVTSALRHLETLDAPLDLERSVVIGHSAGGYLALWAAALPLVSRVVALAAVCDFRLIATAPDTPYAQFAGGMPREVPQAYDALDLNARFPTGAEVIVLCGAADEPLRLRENREYVAAAQRRGEAVTYRELPDTGHFAFMDPRTQAWAAAADAVDRLAG